MARVNRIWSTAVAVEAAEELILEQILLFYGKLNLNSLLSSKSSIEEYAEGELWLNNLCQSYVSGPAFYFPILTKRVLEITLPHPHFQSPISVSFNDTLWQTQCPALPSCESLKIDTTN